MALGSGAIISTAHDLTRFYAALLGGRLLQPAQLAEMTAAEEAPELGVGYGLGIAEIPSRLLQGGRGRCSRRRAPGVPLR